MTIRPKPSFLAFACLAAIGLCGSGPAPAADAVAPDSATIQMKMAPTEGDAPDKESGLMSDPDVYLQLIARLQGKGLYFASLAHLDVFDQRWPGNAKALLLRADALRETGYQDMAAALYQSLSNGPLSAGAHHGLGLIAAQKGDLNAASSDLSLANKLAPTDAAILNDLGYVQILQNKLDDAGFSLHKATELDPGNLRAGSNLALYYILAHKPDQAREVMEWYKLSDTRKTEIYEKAAGLAKQTRP